MKIHPDYMGIQLLQAGIQLFSLESNFSLSWIPGIQLSKSYWEHWLVNPVLVLSTDHLYNESLS